MSLSLGIDVVRVTAVNLGRKTDHTWCGRHVSNDSVWWTRIKEALSKLGSPSDNFTVLDAFTDDDFELLLAGIQCAFNRRLKTKGVPGGHNVVPCGFTQCIHDALHTAWGKMRKKTAYNAVFGNCNFDVGVADELTRQVVDSDDPLVMGEKTLLYRPCVTSKYPVTDDRFSTYFSKTAHLWMDYMFTQEAGVFDYGWGENGAIRAGRVWERIYIHERYSQKAPFEPETLHRTAMAILNLAVYDAVTLRFFSRSVPPETWISLKQSIELDWDDPLGYKEMSCINAMKTDQILLHETCGVIPNLSVEMYFGVSGSLYARMMAYHSVGGNRVVAGKDFDAARGCNTVFVMSAGAGCYDEPIDVTKDAMPFIVHEIEKAMKPLHPMSWYMMPGDLLVVQVGTIVFCGYNSRAEKRRNATCAVMRAIQSFCGDYGLKPVMCAGANATHNGSHDRILVEDLVRTATIHGYNNLFDEVNDAALYATRVVQRTFLQPRMNEALLEPNDGGMMCRPEDFVFSSKKHFTILAASGYTPDAAKVQSSKEWRSEHMPVMMMLKTKTPLVED